MKFLILLSFVNFNNMNLKTATFGSGCFWCTEAIFELVDGVEDVISGYSAGNTENPTYKDVTSGTTNHARDGECQLIDLVPPRLTEEH